MSAICCLQSPAPTLPDRGQTPLHHKGLLTQNLCLRGTLHFTADGIDLGGEEVELITDRAQLQRIALEMAAYWEELD
jgi:hypothetical protein